MGNVQLTDAELEAMLDRAAKRGAQQALSELGLNDPEAAGDIRSLRGLLDTWRFTKSSIWRSTINLITAGILGYIAVSVWFNFKMHWGK